MGGWAILLLIVVVALIITILFLFTDDDTAVPAQITVTDPIFVLTNAPTSPAVQRLNTTNVNPTIWSAGHRQLWIHIAAESQDRWFIILEDNVQFHPQWMALMPHYRSEIPGDAIIVYLGADVADAVDRIVPAASNRLHAYMLNPAGARHLLSVVPESADIASTCYEYFREHPGGYAVNAAVTIGGLTPNMYPQRHPQHCATTGGIIYARP